MKKIIYLVITVLLCTSCESFLDTESYTKKNSENFPVNEEDASQLLTAVYATLSKGQESPGNAWFFVTELASDDRYGGGGENDKDFMCLGHLLYTNLDRFQSFWAARYTGIGRANMTIASLENVADEEVRNQKTGEALFLRAYFYFDLVQMFGDVPLISKAPENVKEAQTAPEQTSQEEIFKYIAQDLKTAYDIMPAYQWNEVLSGTVTKWAAAGLLARVYLFYTGFYQKSSLPLADGGEVTKAEVVAALESCMNNSGHGLLSDFRSIWPYSNKLTKKDYAYVADAPEWVRDGDNKEQVFSVKCSRLGDWDTTTGYANQFSLYFGVRNDGQNDRYKNIMPLGQGWGAGPVTPNLWNEWKADEPTDPRRVASIYNVEEESAGYVYGADSQMEETGLWQKKIIATRAKKNDTEFWNVFTSSSEYWGDDLSDNFQLGNETDLCVIRYADILLMHSELTETTNGINQVRGRVGLSPLGGYSLSALQKERRYELAFEGVRWGDIRRWHIAEAALAKKIGQPIYNRGIAKTMKAQGAGYAARYQATKGFMPIPLSEVELSDGALKQNDGWGTDALFVNWND